MKHGEMVMDIMKEKLCVLSIAVGTILALTLCCADLVLTLTVLTKQ
jgi:hypothetical protein